MHAQRSFDLYQPKEEHISLGWNQILCSKSVISIIFIHTNVLSPPQIWLPFPDSLRITVSSYLTRHEKYSLISESLFSVCSFWLPQRSILLLAMLKLWNGYMWYKSVQEVGNWDIMLKMAWFSLALFLYGNKIAWFSLALFLYRNRIAWFSLHYFCMEMRNFITFPFHICNFF